jgi:hypothetical protein
MDKRQTVERPMWCDDFDADLPKVVPAARSALGNVGDMMLRTHAGVTANGVMSHPTVWHHDFGMVALFWPASQPTSKPAAYYTADPVVDLTLWEAIRDAWVHGYVIVLEDVVVFNGEDAHEHFDTLMWHVRKWPGVSDDDASTARAGVVKMLMDCASKVLSVRRTHD